MKTCLVLLVLMSLFTASAQTNNVQTNKYLGVYQCQNAEIILDLRSDGSAVFEGLPRTWKDNKKVIEIYAGGKLYATFRKEGQDLIREKTGTRYVKVREFQQTER